jgi:N-acetylneuraminic acid mutarotase
MNSLQRICCNLLLAAVQLLLLLLTAHGAMANQLSWSDKTPLSVATSRAASVVVNGAIYVLGGAINNGTTAAVEEYNPLTDSWLARPALSEAKFAGAEAVKDGIVYIAGGSALGPTPTASILSYDTASGSGSTVGTLVTPRIRCSAAILNNKMYVVGGSNNSGTVFDSIEEFDLTSHESITKTTMPMALDYAAVAESQGKIYIIGGLGSNGLPVSNTWQYVPDTNQFIPKSNLPVPVAARAAVADDGKIYLAGGFTDYNTMAWTAEVQVYDPQTDSWQSMGNFPTSRYAQAVGIVNNNLYIIGGSNSNMGPATGNLSVNESADLTSAIGPVVTASPVGGSYATPQTVTLTTNEPATIYYTLDGSTPTTASGVFTSPIGIYANTTLKFFARNSAGNDGPVQTESYTILPPALATTASPAGGTFTAPQTVTLTANYGSATIYYTLDGSTPTTSSYIYSGAINIAYTTTVKFFAVNGTEQESVKSFTYEIIVPPGGSSIGFVPLQITLPYKAWSVATVDFNQDGKADLAVANYERNTVTAYRGNGDGTFSATQEIGAGANPTAVAFGIVNGYDNYIDIVSANSSSNSVSFLLGNGAGAFSNVGSYSTGAGTTSIATGHFRPNAGPPDIAVTNSATGYLNIYYGLGSAAFTPGPSYYVGSGAISVAKGDFNNDNKEDLAVVNDNGQLTIMTGDGAGYFYSVFPGNYTALQYSRSVTAGDINGDGKTDLAIVSDGGEVPGGTAMVTILLGNGTGSFQQYSQFQQPQYTSGAAIADFNSDGKADLVLVNRSNNTMSVLLQGFQFGSPVLINPANPVYFATMQAALDNASNGDVMQAIAGDLYESLTINRGMEITFKGGVSASGAVTGYTILHGTLTISTGSLVAENLVIV